MNKPVVCLALAVLFSLSACGGESPGLAGGRNGQSPPGGSPAPGTGDPATVVIGSTSGGSFQQGVVGIGASDLSSGGSTSLTVQLRTGDGAPYSEEATVTFSSDCHSAGRAEIAEPSVTTSIGTATTTYKDLGCPGSDTITVRTTVNGELLTATGALTVAEATLGSIEFVGADPATIGLKGTGAAGIKETATVRFRVLNDVGGPMPDQEVRFSLGTDVGGLSLATDSALTGSDGSASVIVRAGTVPISVRVTATVEVDGRSISTQSSALTVSTAIADQNSFSLSASDYNPEAWSFDGVEVVLTVLAADRFNNLVPDDTAIIFTTELGAVVAHCLTENGGCSTTWRSQAPRTNSDNEPFDTGRSTILAHAIGEESFYDDDGNGVFDGTQACPPLPAKPPAGADCFYDLPEAWLDKNENGVRESPTEPFVDFNSNGVYDPANGEWDGIVCGGGACTANLVNVRDSVVIVMARSTPTILFFDEAGNRLTTASTRPVLPTTITACINGAGTFVPEDPATLAEVLAGQAQPMPSGTKIEFGATVGEIGGKTDWIVPSTSSQRPDCYPYDLVDKESGENGRFEVTVTAPSGWESYGYVPVTDSPKP